MNDCLQTPIDVLLELCQTLRVLQFDLLAVDLDRPIGKNVKTARLLDQSACDPLVGVELRPCFARFESDLFLAIPEPKSFRIAILIQLPVSSEQIN